LLNEHKALNIQYVQTQNVLDTLKDNAVVLLTLPVKGNDLT